MISKVKNKILRNFTVSELIGIGIMIIACVICLTFSTEKDLGDKIISFFTGAKYTYDFRPTGMSSLYAIALYLPILLRYGKLKLNNVLDIVITIIQLFVNLLVISSLVTIVIGDGTSFFGNFAGKMLIIAIAFSWLGMRSVAGYGWILFIISAFLNINKFSKYTEIIGSIYIVIVFISMLLQVKDLCKISQFLSDFSGQAKEIKNDINFALEDASEKANLVASITTSKTKEVVEKMVENKTLDKTNTNQE